MKNILHAEGQVALERMLQQRTLCAFDFDGTLAPLLSSPALATLAASLKARLDELVSLAPVSVLSGRRRSDLLGFFEEPPYALIGNHGAETADSSVASAIKDACDAWTAEAHDILRAQIGTQDAWVENKGFSVTVHCRTADLTPSIAAALLNTHVLTPVPRALVGPLSVNLLHPDLPTKGDALPTLMRKGAYEHALYIGDEETDECVFRLHDPRILGVRVGLGEESAAEYFLASQADIGIFIDMLIGLCEKARTGRT